MLSQRTKRLMWPCRMDPIFNYFTGVDKNAIVLTGFEKLLWLYFIPFYILEDILTFPRTLLRKANDHLDRRRLKVMKYLFFKKLVGMKIFLPLLVLVLYSFIFYTTGKIPGVDLNTTTQSPTIYIGDKPIVDGNSTEVNETVVSPESSIGAETAVTQEVNETVDKSSPIIVIGDISKQDVNKTAPYHKIPLDANVATPTEPVVVDKPVDDPKLVAEIKRGYTDKRIIQIENFFKK